MEFSMIFFYLILPACRPNPQVDRSASNPSPHLLVLNPLKYFPFNNVVFLKICGIHIQNRKFMYHKQWQNATRQVPQWHVDQSFQCQVFVVNTRYDQSIRFKSLSQLFVYKQLTIWSLWKVQPLEVVWAINHNVQLCFGSLNGPHDKNSFKFKWIDWTLGSVMLDMMDWPLTFDRYFPYP